MRTRLALVLPAAALLAVLASGACSNQGEGEACDSRADNQGTSDCQDGLVCRSISGVSGPRCCPPPGQQTSSAVCAGNTGALPDASPAPPEDGATESGGAEAGAGEGGAGDASDGGAG
jgi:hypothetical protein